MKGKKRKGQRKTLQTNENTKISMQEADEEKSKGTKEKYPNK